MGELAEYLTMAFENIRHNKGRFFLTMLGTIIGIASVITITMVGNAFSRTVSDTLENIGGGQIFLYVGDDGAGRSPVAYAAARRELGECEGRVADAGRARRGRAHHGARAADGAPACASAPREHDHAHGFVRSVHARRPP